MAYHESTPDSVLEAPVLTYSYVKNDKGEYIRHEGSNRAMLRAAGIGVEGWKRSSPSARKKPEHPIVTERRARLEAARAAAVAEKQEQIAKRWWQRKRRNSK